MISRIKAAGGLVRKDAVDTVHPSVRVHPVTGKRCLFLNGEFVTGLVGLKDVESKLIVDFLLNHFVTGQYLTNTISLSHQGCPRMERLYTYNDR